jgi:phosphonate transport system permease protein
MFNRSPFRLFFLQSLFATYTCGVIFYLLSSFLIPLTSDFAKENIGAISEATLIIFIFFVACSWMLDRKKIILAGSFWTYAGSVSFFLSLVIAIRITDFSFSQLTDPEGTAGAARLFNGMLRANWSLLPEALVQIFETVFVAFLATALAVPLAFVMAFFCAKNLMRPAPLFAIYAGLRTILNITRSVEPLIWAVIFSVWVGIGPFAGMLALFIHSLASLAKQYSEIIEGVDEGPIDAIRSTGAHPIQMIWFGIVPQVILPYIAFTFYRWDINVRMATVIGLAGGGGIGTVILLVFNVDIIYQITGGA